jgi:hypothetical protein
MAAFLDRMPEAATRVDAREKMLVAFARVLAPHIEVTPAIRFRGLLLPSHG